MKTKTEALLFLQETFNNSGELELLASAFNDYDLTSVEVADAQAYLQGVIFATSELFSLTVDDINSIEVNAELEDSIYQTVFHTVF